jgi:hypothetical protein
VESRRHRLNANVRQGSGGNGQRREGWHDGSQPDIWVAEACPSACYLGIHMHVLLFEKKP